MNAFIRVTKFAQGEAQWKEFHFDFGVLIGADWKVVEQMTDETDTPMVRALDGEHADKLDLEKMSKGAVRSARDQPSLRVKLNSWSRMSSTMTGLWRVTVSAGTATGQPWRECFE